DRQGLSSTDENGVPRAAGRHHGGATPHWALGRRTHSHEARRNLRDGGEPLVFAAERARTARTNPANQQRYYRTPADAGGIGPHASRTRSRVTRHDPGRADRVNRSRSKPAARRHRHQLRGLPAVARPRAYGAGSGASRGGEYDQRRQARERGGLEASRAL